MYTRPPATTATTPVDDPLAVVPRPVRRAGRMGGVRMNEVEWRQKAESWQRQQIYKEVRWVCGLLSFILMALILILVTLAFIADAVDAAVVEVQVHASRDGYARLHAEGILVIGCTAADMGRCQWNTGRGKSLTTRRVQVHKGLNKIRIKAHRFEDIPADQLDYSWLLSSDPDRVPTEAAVRTMPAPFNYAQVYGQVAGHKLKPKLIKTNASVRG